MGFFGYWGKADPCQAGAWHPAVLHALDVAAVDIADLYKLSISVPVAFEAVAEKVSDVEGVVRRRLRDRFKRERLMARIIPDIEEVLDVGD
ncbi:MAG: hypothetical protein ACOC1F_13800 [Myxococcota bacterium]